MVCQTCPRASEERAMLDRHVSNMNRLPNLQARRDYAEKLEASAGPNVASAVKVAFTLAWNARNQDAPQ